MKSRVVKGMRWPTALRGVGIYLGAAILLGALGFLTFSHAPAKPKTASSATADASSFHYACHGDAESLPCLEQHYQTLTQTQGVTKAFTALKAAYTTDASVKANCHQLTHVIGRTAADAAGGNVDQAYAQGDNFCWSGYYHGVMESIVLKIGAKNLPAKLPTICAQIKAQKPYSFYHYNCVHGLGHGIMDVNDGDLFGSLTECNRLTDSWEQQSCYGGVFMQNEMNEVDPDHGQPALKAGQPMYPCTAVADTYKSQCYLTQTSHALRVANQDFSQVFSECGAIEAQYQDVCYQSLGRDASGNSNSVIGPTVANCMLGPDQDAQSNCIVGAVKDFISYYHSDTQANALCQALDPSLQPVCQTTKQQYYATF